MTSDYYAQAAANRPEPSLEGGASGYFGAPAPTLDPALFNGDSLKPNVCDMILSELRRALSAFGLRGVHEQEKLGTWLHVWIAGSGITYQWQGDRGNGDLDILFGVEWQSFIKANPAWAMLSEADLAEVLNPWLRDNLWPRTAAKSIGGKTFEVTFYLNPGTGADITAIHPYAAYNVSTNSWTTRPPELPADPHQLYAPDWYKAAQRDTDQASDLTGRYKKLLRDLRAAQPGSPGWHNAGSQLHLTISQAQAMLEDIHGGRREAFQNDQGHGYGDWHNFRWQAAKQSGVIKSLAAINDVGKDASAEEDQELYGQQIQDAHTALFHATMVHQNRRDFQ